MTAANYGKLFSGKVTTDDFRAKDFWAETVSNGSYTYYEFVKYKQPEDNIVNNSEEWMIRYQVIPLIRLSEMYLIVMETAELTEANKLYKSYMAEKNALITTDMAREELNAEILNEYRREFWGEGQMFRSRSCSLLLRQASTSAPPSSSRSCSARSATCA